MRFVVISQATDLKALRETLFSSVQPAATTAAALERVKQLNPHVDLQHLAAGTVLLLPDLPSLNPVESRTIGADAFQAFAADVSNGLEIVAKSVHAGTRTQTAERSAVGNVLKTAVVKRVIDSDQLLQKQIDDAQARFVADQKQAEDASKAVDTIQKAATTELAAMGKLLGAFDVGAKSG